MRARTLAIVLGVALAVSVGVNLFAATAAYTVMSRQNQWEHRQGDVSADGQRRPSSRELIGGLSPDARQPVRQALRAAAQRARPEFQASREARRQAIAAASAEPMDTARVEALLDRSRASEVRGRAMLEADAIAILTTLSPADRAAFAQMLDGRGRGGGRDRDRVQDGGRRAAQAPPA